MAEQLLREVGENCDGEFVEVASPSDEINMKNLVLKDLPYLEITKVCIVHNKFLKAFYLIKKEEYEARYGSVTEKLLFHATSERNVPSIIKDNLDWRRVMRGKFGNGVSFSDNADYANFFSNNNNGFKRAFIVAKVLVKNQCQGHWGMKVPEKGTDTATGNGLVYVKFNDNEFYPTHVVYYNAPSKDESTFRYGRW